MRSTVFLASLCTALLWGGCTGREKTAAFQAPPPPEWVTSRPMSGMYYIGIGSAAKTPGSNPQRVARDNALSDLASEIKVNVNTNSLLYTLEREYRFEQEFRETIRVTSNLDLEDFEVAGTWEDASTVWVYYRLSKSAYADRQRQRHRAALELATDFLAKAQSAEANGQYAASVDFYLRGLQALERHWGENNSTEYQGRQILADNELYVGLRSLLIECRVAIENELELNYQNRFRTKAEILVTTSRSEKPLEGVPLAFEYFGTNGRVRGRVATNADGRVSIPINEADRERATNNFVVQIDTDQLYQPFQSDQFMRKLTQSLQAGSSQKPIAYRAPSMYMDSRERNMGAELSGKPLSAAVMASLGRRGVRFANSSAQADLTMRIESNTRQGGMAQGFATAMLDINITIVDNKSGETVYKMNRTDVKGVDLDYDRAGNKAYQNVTRNIESEIMRRMVADVF